MSAPEPALELVIAGRPSHFQCEQLPIGAAGQIEADEQG
jgi:hypothetical protein